MVISCKMSSIACTTALSDTISTPTLDSVKKLVPIGFFVLNEHGARLSVKAKIDAQAYYLKWQIADEALTKMTIMVNVVSMDRNRAVEANARSDLLNADLRKQLRSAKFWKYGSMAVAGAVAVSALLNR